MSKEAQKVIEFLDTCEYHQPLVRYAHHLLCLVHNFKYIKVGQPDCINNVGPSNEEQYLQIEQYVVRYNLTVQEAINFFKTY